MQSDTQRAFVASERRAILATLSPSGQPRLVPICFVLADRATQTSDAVLYSPLDEKPKQGGDVRQLARVRDIAARPMVTLLFERWSEDWSQLSWLRARGRARLVEPQDDPETHRETVEALRLKYPQYREQHIETLPMIRIVISEVVAWDAAG